MLGQVALIEQERACARGMKPESEPLKPFCNVEQDSENITGAYLVARISPPGSVRRANPWRATMLSEKFILFLEAIRRQQQQGDDRVVSTSPHIPVALPPKKPA